MKIPCWHCGLFIESLSDDVPRCRKCNKPLCWPDIRDCWEEHYDAKHAPRPARVIEDVTSPHV